jgi:hypothetical protein
MEEMMARTAEKMKQWELEKIDKEATKILQREWQAMYWKRSNNKTEEQYIEENWDRAIIRAKKVVASEATGSG